MANLSVDTSLLPVSGTYVMTAEEAAEAARLIAPSAAISMHYSSIIGTDEDTIKFKQVLADTCQIHFPKRD